MKSIVVAYDAERGIGARGELPWGRDLPSDLKHFQEITMGGSLIMGRKTFESIGRALPGRENVVVSHRPIATPAVIAVHGLAAAYDVARGNQFVIGGASLYEQALPDVDVVYATEVDAIFDEADTFFPELGEEWRERARESHTANGNDLYDFDFVTYVRR